MLPPARKEPSVTIARFQRAIEDAARSDPKTNAFQLSSGVTHASRSAPATDPIKRQIIGCRNRKTDAIAVLLTHG